MKCLLTIILSGLLVAAAFPQSKKAPAKPKSTVTDQKKAAAPKTSNEKAEWETAIAIADPAERLAALRKFAELFPQSKRVAEASALIAAIEAGFGNDKLAAGDLSGATESFKAAVSDAPKPVPDALFTDTLSKIPTILYFRGLREASYNIAKILEEKADSNAGQLLSIATFYISTENGREAKRVAENAILLEPESSAAYQTLGLANRVDFQLEESAAAYTKALELEPDSLKARGGLAEMDRALGKADEAIALYREMLTSDEANGPARTGLILALFDAGKREEAETEMAASLESKPANVLLLAGAAYWYAAHGEGTKAVDLAQKALDVDPRFIWSHIALARGYMEEKRPLDAERTLLLARRYGNFPTLEYEIASARFSAGLYREAAEELSKSFSVKDDAVLSNLGGRVPHRSASFTELVSFERRASIFTPTAAGEQDSASQLKALLQFRQELNSTKPNSEVVTKAVDEFVRGDDAMKVHRQIFAASSLLDKKVALPKALEIVQSAPQALDAGLGTAEPTMAVLASELYEPRRIAAERGEYVNVPNVARQTLSSILRGRIEEITGWTLYQMDDPSQASIHLRRASLVLPVSSSWWRSSTWQLGSALALEGKEADALEAYIKSYKGSEPDTFKYNTIEALYKRVKGNTLGLEERVGPPPGAAPSSETVAQTVEPQPVADIKPSLPRAVPVAKGSVPIGSESPAATPESPPPAEVISATIAPDVNTTDQPAPLPTVGLTPENIATGVPEPTPADPQTAVDSDPSVPGATPETALPTPIIEATPEAASPAPIVEGTPETALPTPIAETTPEASPDTTPLEVPSTVAEETPAPTPLTQRDEEKPPEEKPAVPMTGAKQVRSVNDLFPPIIINIPTPDPTNTKAKKTEEKPLPPSDESKAVDEAKPTPSPATSESLVATDVTPIPSPTAEIMTEGAKPSVESSSPLETPIDNNSVKTSNPETVPTSDPSAGSEKSSEALITEDKVEVGVPKNESRPRLVTGKTVTKVKTAPCKITVSEENISLRSGGGDLAVIVGRTDEDDLDGLTAISTSPLNVSVRQEVIKGVTARALFVVRSISPNTGEYKVSFVLPCGIKEIVVNVR